jgi:hypothetical protein
MPRIRKDSETISNSGYSNISRARRESERLRNDPDNLNAAAHKNISNPPIIREV